MTGEEVLKKRLEYDARLSPQDRSAANRYSKLSLASLVFAVFTALIVGIAAKFTYLDFLILPSIFISAISLGMFMVYSGKATRIRKYNLGKTTPYLPGRRYYGDFDNPPLFDDAALAAAKTSIFGGCAVIVITVVIMIAVLLTALLFA